jgi:hypothetical protein
MKTQTQTHSSDPPERPDDRPPSAPPSGAPPLPDDDLDAEAGAEAWYERLFGTPALDPPDHHGFFVTTLATVLRWPRLLGTLKAVVRVAENMRMERAEPFNYEIAPERGGQSA